MPLSCHPANEIPKSASSESPSGNFQLRRRKCSVWARTSKVQTGLVKASPRLVRGRNGTIGFSAFGQPAEPLRALRAANLCVNRGVVVSRPNNPPPPNKRRATYLDAPQTPRRAGFSACTPRSPPCRSTKITCKSHDMFQKIFQKFSRKIFLREYFLGKYFCENISSENIPAEIFPRKIFLRKYFLGECSCESIFAYKNIVKIRNSGH